MCLPHTGPAYCAVPTLTCAQLHVPCRTALLRRAVFPVLDRLHRRTECITDRLTVPNRTECPYWFALLAATEYTVPLTGQTALLLPDGLCFPDVLAPWTVYVVPSHLYGIVHAVSHRATLRY